MIVCCGEALVDLVPDPVPGGGPFNVAIAAARLGVPTAFAGPVSTDEYGERIMAHLLANGVDVTLCPRLDAPTARAIVEHTPHLVFRFEGEGTADTRLERVELAPLGDGPHVLHGGTLGLFRGTTAEAVATAAERHDGLVSLDPNIRPQIIDDRPRWDHFHERWLTNTAVYKASDEDLAWIWPGREASSLAEQLLADGVGVVIVTRGSEGLTVHHADGQEQVPAVPVDVIDTVGAGDTIVATVLASLVEAGVVDRAGLGALGGRWWSTVGRRAVTAAAITCGRPGADAPRRHELG